MKVGIRFFHGRKNPNQELDGWGEDGPVLGPFDGVHQTYNSHIRPVTEGESEGDITLFEDMYYYDGMYYGDMVILSWESAKIDFPNKIQPLDPEKTKPLIER